MPQAIGLAVGSFLFSIGAPLALVNYFAIGGGGALLFGLGVSTAAGGLLGSGQQSRAASIKPSDGQQTIRQAVPDRWKHYGRVRVAGPAFWFDADETTDTFYLGLMVNHGRIDAFEQFFIDQNEVSIDGSGNVTTAPYSSVTTQILTRLGAATETAYSEIATAFGFEDVRGDGVATMLGLFEAFSTSELQLDNYPTSRPSLKATIRASVCYDPRESSHDREDPTTWEWSENWAVCFLNWLMDPDGLAVPWARIAPNLTHIKEQMDICDEDVLSPNAGGTEKRYRIAATYLLSERPADVLAKFLRTADAVCWQRRDGSVTFSVGKFVEPTVTISNSHILGYEGLERGQDPVTAIAGARAQYRSPDHDYREQEAEPWPTGADVVALGEERVTELDLTWVPSFGQCRRLMKRAVVRANATWRGKIRTTLAGLRAIDERTVRIVMDELEIDETFEITDFQFDPNGSGTCVLEVNSLDATIDVWDAATEEGTAPGLVPVTAWETEQETQDDNRTGYSLRMVISADDAVASGSQLRLRFETHPSYSTFVVNNVSIVPRSGTSDDGTTVPTEVTFSGDSGFSLGPGEQITSDWIDFDFDSTKDHLVIIDFASTPTSRPMWVDMGVTTYYRASYASYDEQNVTGFSSVSRTYSINRIEVRGSI